jgi:DNA-binding NtrC family response regulator
METKTVEKKRVLLVDNEKTLLWAFKKALGGNGLLLDTADTAENCISLLQRIDYDFVVSDLRLSEHRLEEGFEILQYVKNHKPGTKVIIMTGNGSSQIKEKAYALGADLFLEKPVPPGILKEAIFGL